MALISVAEALDHVLAHATPLPAEEVPLAEADGRVLAAPLKALRTQPPADVSAMDGYAVRAADVATAPVRLKVIGEVPAGRPFAATIRAGEAARIFTGGFVPDGADVVVVQELTKRDGDVVEVQKPTVKGRNVRPQGLDFRAGDALFAKGHRLTARDLQLAAGMNHPLVPVYGRPKVALFATGDELVPPGTEPGPGQIVYSNGFALAALAREEGAAVTDLGVVGDKLDETIAAVRRARAHGVDILVTTGGASVGDYDLVQKALAAEGMALSFWKIAMRPGRPLLHGRLGAMAVLGLPGNPVSSYVCAFLFLVPLIRKLGGRDDLVTPTETAALGCDLPENDERADYLRATLKNGPDGPVATPFSTQDSSMMAPLAQAGCLVIREPHAPPAKAGSRCTIVRFAR
ncbi:MAG TPA: gephyrin-like molybdotransferase Glp [Xanthobacteraceae bacterium]|nr:gephyrin-like molybdotransferase Glp [Xanthobacteraceae bacterium]